MQQFEKERKFLVDDPEAVRKIIRDRKIKPTKISQGYLKAHRPDEEIRVRISRKNLVTKAHLTSKQAQVGNPDKRIECEDKIEFKTALLLLEIADQGQIMKSRYKIPAGKGLNWEVDFYQDEKLNGLVTAEIELPQERTLDQVIISSIITASLAGFVLSFLWSFVTGLFDINTRSEWDRLVILMISMPIVVYVNEMLKRRLRKRDWPKLEFPQWLGFEVTGKKEYKNSELAKSCI